MNDPRDTPTHRWRPQYPRRWTKVGWVVGVSIFMFGVFSDFRGTGRVTAVLGIASGVAVMAGIFVDDGLHRRQRRRVEACDFAVCLGCGFELTGLADRGACPECGIKYDRRWLESRWRRRWFRRVRRPLRS